MATGTRIGLGGVAKVFCVHDRQKRQVTDPERVRFLGRALNVQYDPRHHKLQTCACCQNLFVTPDDTPRLCDRCSGVTAHPLAAPLPEPLEGAL